MNWSIIGLISALVLLGYMGFIFIMAYGKTEWCWEPYRRFKERHPVLNTILWLPSFFAAFFVFFSLDLVIPKRGYVAYTDCIVVYGDFAYRVQAGETALGIMSGDPKNSLRIRTPDGSIRFQPHEPLGPRE